MGVVPQLDGLENGKRQRGGSSGNVARDHDRRAELTQSTSKGQNHSTKNPSQRERRGDGEENSRITGSQRAGDLLEARIHFLEGYPRRTHQQRK